MNFLDAFIPKNISTYGYAIDELLLIITLIVLPVTFITFFFLLFFTWKGVKSTSSNYIPGKSGFLVVLVLTADLIVLILDIFIFASTLNPWQVIQGDLQRNARGDWIFPGELNPTPRSEVYEIKVEAKQFAWSFYYPGEDGVLNTKDDIHNDYSMHVPVDKKIVIHLTSLDVIHNLWVPSLRFKQDTIPGRVITRWFEVDSKNLPSDLDWSKEIDIGSIQKLSKEAQDIRELMPYLRKSSKKEDQEKKLKSKKRLKEIKEKLKSLYQQNLHNSRLFEIICAEICGNNHYSMNGWLVLHKEADFDKWLQNQMKKNNSDISLF